MAAVAAVMHESIERRVACVAGFGSRRGAALTVPIRTQGQGRASFAEYTAMKPALSLLAASLALVLSACANDEAGNDRASTDTAAASTTAMNPPTPPADPAASGPATMAAGSDDAAPASAGQAASEGDRKALMAVAEVDRHEIAAAQDALSKNVEGNVRRYAESLRDDHTRNLAATRGLIDSTGGGMTATTQDAAAAPAPIATGTGSDMPADAGLAAMQDEHEAERTRLSSLDGAAFTTAWVAAMVTGHEEALAKLDNELIPGASDPLVVTHLRDTRTAIARHLDAARALQPANR